MSSCNPGRGLVLDYCPFASSPEVNVSFCVGNHYAAAWARVWGRAQFRINLAF